MISIPMLRQAMGVSATQDALVKQYADAVTDLWEMETRTIWNAKVGIVTPLYPAYSDNYIWLPARNVSNLVISESTVEGSGYVAVGATDFVLRGENGRITRLRSSMWSPFLQATYDAGYTVDTCPKNVQLALQYQALFMQQRNATTKIDVNSQSLGKGSSQLMTADYHPFFKTQVDKYRRR